MVDPNPDLGIDAGFDPAEFRRSIHFAMQMGTPPDPDKRPKFLKKSTSRTYWQNGVQLGSTPRLDRDGKPLDPTIEVRRGATTEYKMPDDSAVDCAIEVARADSDELPVGNFRPTKIVVTLLDDEYEVVRECRELIYNGDRYQFGYEPEAYGLFSVGVHTMIFYAIDES